MQKTVFDLSTGSSSTVDMTPEEIAAIGSAPTPEPSPPVPTLVASGAFTVSDGWIEGVEAAAGIGMVFPTDVGIYWVFFTQAQPDLSYATYVSASQGQINVSARSMEHVELCVKEAGSPIDPSEFSINIVRAQ